MFLSINFNSSYFYFIKNRKKRAGINIFLLKNLVLKNINLGETGQLLYITVLIS